MWRPYLEKTIGLIPTAFVVTSLIASYRALNYPCKAIVTTMRLHEGVILKRLVVIAVTKKLNKGLSSVSHVKLVTGKLNFVILTPFYRLSSISQNIFIIAKIKCLELQVLWKFLTKSEKQAVKCSHGYLPYTNK